MRKRKEQLNESERKTHTSREAFLSSLFLVSLLRVSTDGEDVRC
jgi:hypothetical protein